MKTKAALIAAVVASTFLAAPAYALKNYLVSEWMDKSTGDWFCKYEDGTVLNVGSGRCARYL